MESRTPQCDKGSRINIMYCPDIWQNQEGYEWPNSKFPNPVCCHGPKLRSPNQTTLLVSGTRYISCLSLSGWFQLPASPWNYSNKPITSSHRNQGHLSLLLLQILLPPPWLVLFVPQGTSLISPCDVQCPLLGLQVCLMNKLLFYFICSVSSAVCLAIFLSRVRDPSLPSGVNRI